MIITNSRYALVGYFITWYPTEAHGIIVIYPVAGLCSIFWYSWAVDLQRNYQWSIFWGTYNKLLLMVYFKFFCCYCWQKVFHMHFSFSFLWLSMALFKRKKSLKITMMHILWKLTKNDYEIIVYIERFLIFLIFLRHQKDEIRMKNFNHQVHKFAYLYFFHMYTEPNSRNVHSN